MKAPEQSNHTRSHPHLRSNEMTVRENVSVTCLVSQSCNNVILLSQPQGQILDEIVVSVPLIPAHGAVARVPNQVIITETDLHKTQESLF